MKIKYLLPLTLIAIALARVTATTVVPPTFDQLVQQAELIFQGTVTDTKSVWEGEGAQRTIETYVTFQIADSVNGNAGSSYTIRMLGGTVGDESLVVTDAPKFQVGDREILFVEHNYDQFVPLVGIGHGRFHVQRDEETGRDVVVDHEGAPSLLRIWRSSVARKSQSAQRKRSHRNNSSQLLRVSCRLRPVIPRNNSRAQLSIVGLCQRRRTIKGYGC